MNYVEFLFALWFQKPADWCGCSGEKHAIGTVGLLRDR